MSGSNGGDGNIIMFPFSAFELTMLSDGNFEITFYFPPGFNGFTDEQWAAITQSIQEAIERPEFREAVCRQNGRPFQLGIMYTRDDDELFQAFHDKLESQGWKHIWR